MALKEAEAERREQANASLWVMYAGFGRFADGFSARLKRRRGKLRWRRLPRPRFAESHDTGQLWAGVSAAIAKCLIGDWFVERAALLVNFIRLDSAVIKKGLL